MSLEDLKKQFIVDEDSMRRDLEPLVRRAIKYCVVDTQGRIHLKDHSMAGKLKIKLALAAKAIAYQLDNTFKAEISLDELATVSGLPANQARARVAEVVEERFAESVGRGSYRANVYRLPRFMDELEKGESNDKR